jgi:hypothetical protein
MVFIRFSYLILFVFLSAVVYGQDDSYKNWMIREVTKDSAFIGNIYSETNFGTKRFFWPADIQIPSQDNPTNGDHLFKSSLGIFTALEGTGRIYRIEPDAREKSKLNYLRQDSTIMVGYNFGAIVFFDQDTLYSLGGYGIWNFSYLLRYFRQSSYGWEVLPVNKPIVQLYSPNKSFFDHSTRSFYNIDIEFFTEGLKESNKRIKAGKTKLDTVFVRKLNLSSKNWETMGVVNPEALKIIERTYPVGTTPWGILLSAGDRFNNSFYLLHYNQNRIMEIKDRKYGSAIRDARLSGMNGVNFPERRIVYYFQDSLKILNSNRQKFTFRLRLDDFEETQHTIWLPVPESSIFSYTNIKQQFPAIGLIFFLAGIGLFYYSRRNNLETGKTDDFDNKEIQLLRAMALKPNLMAKPDEIDQLFDDRGARSPEALKKRRSILIRSINRKYSDHFDDEEDLIRTERLETDRRMVQYILDQKKYIKISKNIKDK